MSSEQEVLVISSKVKAYIKNADLKCSASVIDALSDRVRAICDAAIANAREEKRKTVQDKDIR